MFGRCSDDVRTTRITHVPLSGKKLKERFQRALEQGVITQVAYDAWNTANSKWGGKSARSDTAKLWADLEQAKKSILALIEAPTPNAMAAVGVRTEEAATRIEEHVCQLKALVEDMHTVTVRGQTVSGASPSVIATQTEYAIVAMKMQHKAAKDAKKAEVLKAKAEAAAAKAEAKARAKAEKAAATATAKAENLLKQLKFKGDGISTMLPAAATDIVADVRAKVQAMFAANSPGVSIQLTFGDIELRDGYTEAAASTDGPRHNTLGEYGVPNKATIAVVVTRPLANISVKQRGQNAITLNVEASNTIEDVKYKIQEAIEIAPDQQELTIGKVALTDDNQTLSQAGVKQDSTLQLRKYNKGIGNGPVDSRMENRTEPRGCQQTFSKP